MSSKEEIKLKRLEYLQRAREKKALLKSQKENPIPEPEPIPEPIPEPKKTNTKTKDKKTKPANKTLDISTVEDVKKAEEQFEVKEDVIRIKAPKKKTIVKRLIEIEESSTDEEIQEEIIHIPKQSSKSKQSIKEYHNKQSIKETIKANKLYADIFPN